ncbi:hypothetical protein [Halomarina ordinaria]|uniref:Uncharacterized protein n=1 Tax=Halomarina ordinaria TaxID=3033939 RepID=A0ABD5UDK5_9EURY|nr:hypothetical protein [Halomarina sp. PSRA2]
MAPSPVGAVSPVAQSDSSSLAATELFMVLSVDIILVILLTAVLVAVGRRTGVLAGVAPQLPSPTGAFLLASAVVVVSELVRLQLVAAAILAVLCVVMGGLAAVVLTAFDEEGATNGSDPEEPTTD